MNADNPTRKKQLGQYFTGVPVARLLAALAGANNAVKIIDPMVGIGDMLHACLAVGAHPDQLVGIDVDPLAIERARARFAGRAEISLDCADAFSGPLPKHQFDLTITNPPYIRYQSGKQATGIDVPTGPAIRRSLLRTIEARAGLSASAKALFLETARAYPGTADVAVPAWILSAALVDEGGTLAVVVPQAWLSRDYARAIRAMLDRAFEVQYLVEDGDASWFDDAQVRTHLLVARRCPVTGSSTGRRNIILARATADLSVAGLLVGGLGNEHDVAAALNAVTGSHPTVITPGLTARVERHGDSTESIRIAPQLLNLVDGNPPKRTLADYGWRCGQGMRTGANDFFYLTRTPGGAVAAKRWGHRPIQAPEGTLIPTIRRQADLSEDLHVDSRTLQTLLLNLRGWATAQDRAAAVDPEDWDTRFRTIPTDLAAWIADVAQTPVSDSERGKLFPHLTAVAPNIRVGRLGEPVGYWYQLPKLARRHQPEVFLPRVCGARPYSYINTGGAVVDANFSTLWPTTLSALPSAAMFALLNSTWVWANLEKSCTVLGGGALKVEATDLRRIPLPEPDDLAIEDLARLGKSLNRTTDTELLKEVDALVNRAIGTSDNTEELAELAQQALAYRSRP